jgi:hypothetical protein
MLVLSSSFNDAILIYAIHYRPRGSSKAKYTTQLSSVWMKDFSFQFCIMAPSFHNGHKTIVIVPFQFRFMAQSAHHWRSPGPGRRDEGASQDLRLTSKESAPRCIRQSPGSGGQSQREPVEQW